MKHNFKIYAAMACSAIALASCSSDAVEDVKTAGKQQMVFTAEQEINAGSRTSLGSDLSVLWSTGDALSVLDGRNNNDFTLKTGNGTAEAKFAGTAMPATTYYAVYPYQSGAEVSGNVISGIVIPTEQHATAGTFDPKANIMTAVSDQTNNFQFKNVSSSARIITTADCKKITFTAGSEDKIAGKFSMTVDADGIVTASTATDATNTVTLVPSSGETFAAGTYYISINPGTISSLKVECEYTDKTLYQSVAYPISMFKRGTIINLGEASIAGGWKEKITCCCPDENHPHMIDLGLPSGIKFACMNVGAQHPHEYGDYFAWAATEPWYTEGHAYDDPCTNWIAGKTGYDWVNAPYQTANTTAHYMTKWTKYVGSTTSSEKDPSATDENALKTVLDPEDDAAQVNWGGTWRMPTEAEIKELKNNCYLVWTSNYNGTGKAGRIVYKAKADADKGKYSSGYTPAETYDISSDIHIFLPAAGCRFTGSLFRTGSYGYYWSSSIDTSDPCSACQLDFFEGHVFGSYQSRYYGRSVRAVCP